MIVKISTAAALAAALVAAPAFAQEAPAPDASASKGPSRKVTVAPYIELTQVLTADIQSGDVLTYTSVAAGVDTSIETRRVSVNLSARYEHQFSYDSGTTDSDVITGLANAQIRIAPGLSLEAGGIATRARNDIRGAAPVFFGNNDTNVSDVYSAYVGPSFATGRGAVFVNGGYRFGYAKVTSPNNGTGIAPGSPQFDYFDTSKTHMAQLSTGFKSGTILPFGVTLSGAWVREDQGQLDQRFEDIYGRGDIVLPLTSTFAVTGGVGYEKLTSSARDPVVGPGNVPVTDSKGRFVTDPNSPRRIAYRTDGIYWDAGAVWRPSPRTVVEGHVGRRYGSWSFTGALAYAPSNGVGVSIGVYDSVETFSGQLQRSLKGLPKEFTATRDLLAQQFSGCTFGTTGGGASGACMNSVFQSISTATYRSRGVDAAVTMSRGRSTLGIGGGYSNRKFYAPNSPGVAIIGTSDESYYAQVFYTAPLGANSGLSANVFGNYYDSSLAPGIWSYGATGTVYRNFGRLSTSASVGAYSFSQDGQDDQTQAQATVGARYRF